MKCKGGSTFVAIVCLQLIVLQSPLLAQEKHAPAEPSKKTKAFVFSGTSEFARVYLKSKESGADADSLLKSAKEDETAERNASACAKYLVAVSDALASGNVRISKPIIEKIRTLATKLDPSSKQELFDALMNAGEFTQQQSRYLTADYLFSAALQLKEETGAVDKQLLIALLRLATVRGFESQYVPAETLYRRAILLLESGKVVDESLLLQSLSSMANLSSQRGLYAEAAVILQRLMTYIDKIGKPPDMEVCPYYVQYSHVLRRLGKPDEARAKMAIALDVVGKFLTAPSASFNRERIVSLADAMRESVRPQLAAPKYDDQVQKVLLCSIQLKVSAGIVIDEGVQHDVEEACKYFEKFGKLSESADLYAAVLKATNIEEEPRTEMRAAYLAALKSANRLDEIARIQAEMEKQDRKKWQEAEVAAEAELAKAKKIKDDPDSLLKKYAALVKVRMAEHRTVESMPLLRDMIALCQKQEDIELDDDTVTLMWAYIAEYLSELTAKKPSAAGTEPKATPAETLTKEEHLIYDIASIDEKSAAERTELGRISDLSQITEYFTKREKYADAAAFMKYVIGLRRKYRPKDLVAASHGYEVLAEIYRDAGDAQQYRDARKQFLSIMEARYAHPDPRTIRPRLVVVVLKIQEGKLDEAQAVMNQVIATLESAKQEPEGSARADILVQIRKMVGMYLANYQITEADNILRKGMALSGTGAEPPWLGIFRDRVIDYYCRAAEYEKAEDLCKLRIMALTPKQSDELAQTKLRLSEVYLYHANYLKKHDKATEANRVAVLSDQELQNVIELLDKASGSSNNPASKSARRRHESLLSMGATARAVLSKDTFGIDVRHHLADMVNQSVPAAREPLTFALFGRSEVLLTGNATTWSCGSDVDIETLTILDTGGDVGSFGKIKLKDDASVHGTLMARNVYLLQNNVNLADNKFVGNAPRPYPLPPPISLKPGLKAIRATIKQGVVQAPPPGTIIDLGELLLDCNTGLALPPGDYIVSKITLLNGSHLDVVNTSISPETAGDSADQSATRRAVRFFFRDMPPASDGRQPVQVIVDGGSSMNVKGFPYQMQLWYGGSGIIIAKGGAQIHGVIYAPRALIALSGERTCLFGTAVGDEVRLSGEARAVFDKNLPVPKAFGMPKISIRPLNNAPVLSQENAGVILLGVDPDSEELQKGDTLLGNGQAAAALEHYIKATAQDPSCVTFAALARCRYLLKQYPEALGDCNKALLIVPNDPFALATRGEILCQLNQEEQGKNDYRKALQLMPLPESHLELMAAAICELGLGNANKAIDLLSECILLRPDYCPAYEYRARTYEKQGQNSLANQDRQKLKDVVIAQQKNSSDKTHQ